MLLVGLDPQTTVSFFNDLDTEMGTMLVDSILIMASKRIILWKEYMSRDKHRSWLPRYLRETEEQHYGRNTY
jgi:hypothetical protein